MLYYSHVNEDNKVEKDLFRSSACGTVVAVTGSGERVLALIDNEQCKNIYAVDVNEEALFLLQLKLAILENYSIEEYFQFIGHHDSGKEKRRELFERIKDKLDPFCRKYWEKNSATIEKGILYAGHFEKFLARVRPSVNLFLGKNFHLIFSGLPAQSGKFPGLRWKLLKQIYSFRWIYKLWGNKDVAFISNDATTQYIPDAINNMIFKNESASSFMMHLIFKGHLREMKEEDLPPSLQQNVLAKIKTRLNTSGIAVHYHHADLLSFVKTRNASLRSNVFYSVSDVLSFERPGYMDELLDCTRVSGNTIVWRSFLRNRVDDDLKNKISEKHKAFYDLTEKETTRMYQVFAIQN